MGQDVMDPAQVLDQDLYQRLFEQRTIVLGEPLEQRTSNRLCQALLLLAAEDSHADIRLLINSPGGSVPGMLAIRDCMRAIPNEVCTINLGMAYSAGQFLLSSGTTSRRFSMPHAKVLLHQGSSGIAGTAMDIAIQADDLLLRDARGEDEGVVRGEHENPGKSDGLVCTVARCSTWCRAPGHGVGGCVTAYEHEGECAHTGARHGR